MNLKKEIKIIGLKGIPLIKKGDQLSEIIINALNKNEISLEDRDIIVIAQSIISKSSGRIRNLNEISPSKKAIELYNSIAPKIRILDLPEKSPELIQAILDESKKLIRSEHVLISETRQGFICADAGIDKSNVEEEGFITLLPKNPDHDAEKIRIALKSKTNKDIGVIISDSFGRAFRVGAIGTAIGVSGIEPILDMRGKKDLFGHQLQTTIIGQVDSLAAAAQLIMGESDEGIPVVLIKGYNFKFSEKASIKTILREKELDLFREPKHESFLEILKNRRSYKMDFAFKDVDKKIIEECIELACWAPSAHNGQFWRYIILERGKQRESLIDKMNEKFRKDLHKDRLSEAEIKKKVEKTRSKFLKAPFLILLCLDEQDLEKYQDIERMQNEFFLGIQSISSSATYLLLAFEIKKLAACWYCAPLFAKKIIKEALKLPKSYIPMAFFTVGYPIKAVKAPNRKKFKEIIFEPSI
ncbi:MAG: coenzyme F420-0:L-glutamate ligase [Candidatus Hodarchaeota archaeon]